jgi:hypothetical protein
MASDSLFLPAGVRPRLRFLEAHLSSKWMMRCTSCGSENPDSKQFCGDCGAPFGGRCPKCSAENHVDKKFCGNCGTALANKAAIDIVTTHTQETPAPEIRMRPEQLDPPATADGERKMVTALFADIKGSTELMRDLDPEEARAIRCFSLPAQKSVRCEIAVVMRFCRECQGRRFHSAAMTNSPASSNRCELPRYPGISLIPQRLLEIKD